MGRVPILAEVVGFRQHRVLLMPLGEMRGLGPGSEVVKTGESFKIPVGDSLLGRVIDGRVYHWMGRDLGCVTKIIQFIRILPWPWSGDELRHPYRRELGPLTRFLL